MRRAARRFSMPRMHAWSPPDDAATAAARSPREAAPADQFRRAVEAIAARHDLARPDEAMFPSGSDVVWGAGPAVIKLTAPAFGAELATEAAVLRHVEDRLPFATPEVLAEGELSGWPYLVMSRLTAGQPVSDVWPELNDDGRRGVAAAIGRAAAALHALPTPRLPDTPWMDFAEALRADAPTRMAARGVHPSWIEALPARLAPLDLRPRRPVLLHTELLPEHVRVAPDAELGWQVVGMLDFADARVGHPDYEWAGAIEFIFRGAPGCLRACLEAYGEADPGPERAAALCAWGPLHRFGDLERAAAAVEAEPGDWDGLIARLYDLKP